MAKDPNFPCPPFPGSVDYYVYFVGDDQSGDKFLKLPYGSKENVSIFDVNNPSQAPFLQSIGEEKWPKRFRKEEGAHVIVLRGLYPCQDLLKDIGLRRSVSEDVSEDESDSSDDSFNFESGDELD